MQTKTRIIATTTVLGALAFAAPAAAGPTGGTSLNKPVVGFVAAASAASTGGIPLFRPIVGMATSIQSQMNYTPDDATRAACITPCFPKKLEFSTGPR